MLFLVCGDAYFGVEGEPPTGVYGIDWYVVSAPDGRTAVRISTESREVSTFPASILTLDEALRAFGK